MPTPLLTEFSTNFDGEMVRPFVERLPPLIQSGFGPAEVERVCELATTLLHDEERTLEFAIIREGRAAAFHVRIFMDDIDAPDIYFFSPPSLTECIEAEFARFAEERGL